MKAENAKLAVTNSELTKIKDELGLEKETWSKTKEELEEKVSGFD